MVCAAAVRLSTLGLQSFWYDEAFTPVHVLHPSLSATLSSVASYEKTPPLWDIVIWAWSRVFGTGEIALRTPSAPLSRPPSVRVPPGPPTPPAGDGGGR